MESLIHSGIKDFFLNSYDINLKQSLEISTIVCLSINFNLMQNFIIFTRYIRLPRSNISTDNDKILESEDISEIFWFLVDMKKQKGREVK